MSTIKQEYQRFLKDNFNGLIIRQPLFYIWDKGLRFDLQVGPVNAEGYFDEVLKRASALFQTVFEPDNTVFMVVHSSAWRRRRIRLSNYSLKQVKGLRKNEIAYSEIRSLYNPNDRWNVAIIKVSADRINYNSILTAIGNTDFPAREPRLTKSGTGSTQDIFFVNIDKKVVFNMYDDRGLDIIADDTGALRSILDRHHDWILDYDREKILRTVIS